jgi:hypothetical protein
VEVLLSKFQYSQPTHRHLQDLNDRSLPVSPGTVAGGLQAIKPLFKPIMAGLYQKQMTEALFHNDETRWEVFIEMEGKGRSNPRVVAQRSQAAAQSLQKFADALVWPDLVCGKPPSSPG